MTKTNKKVVAAKKAVTTKSSKLDESKTIESKTNRIFIFKKR